MNALRERDASAGVVAEVVKLKTAKPPRDGDYRRRLRLVAQTMPYGSETSSGLSNRSAASRVHFVPADCQERRDAPSDPAKDSPRVQLSSGVFAAMEHPGQNGIRSFGERGVLCAPTAHQTNGINGVSPERG
jgi:hypothetical protein